MPKYEVTLTGNVKANHQEYRSGEKLTVDEALYDELKTHNIIKNVHEIEEKKTTTRKTKASANTEDGD